MGGGAFANFFSSVRGLPGGILAAGTDSYINCINSAGDGSAYPMGGGIKHTPPQFLWLFNFFLGRLSKVLIQLFFVR